MIIQRLHELAQRESLAAGIAFEKSDIPFLVSFDETGQYLGIIDRRQSITLPGKGRNPKPKTVLDNGKEILVPRAHGNPASQGFARYFVDTIPRVLPFVFDPKDENKSAASRRTFWEQIAHAASQTRDPALIAAEKLGKQCLENPEIQQQIKTDIETLGLKAQSPPRCCLGFIKDQGKSLTEKPEIQKWYAQFFDSLNADKTSDMGMGFCQISGEEAPIPVSHGFQFKGIPGGLATGTYLISLDKSSFQSYGLDGAVNSGIGLPVSQSYSLALQALIEENLPQQSKSRFKVGGNLILFWTREVQDLSFMALLDAADPAAVESLLESVHRGKHPDSINGNDFYLLVLTGNAARIVVRDYLEAPLEAIRQRFSQWFQDQSLVFLNPGYDEKKYHSLYDLVMTTTMAKGDPLPTTANRLLMAALRGDPLPESILAACLNRLKAEGVDGCTRPRLSLVKLFLVRKGITVTEGLDPSEKNPAYLYGRLLEVFDEIQYGALEEINAGVVDKFYGTFSAAPGLVFARLFANAQNHLRKLKNEKPGVFVVLERKLTELASLLPAQPPKGQLSLRDQGLFALGFYHQKALRNQERVERKAAREAAAPKE